MPLILLNPYLLNLSLIAREGLVLAMDFEENGWIDLINPSRTFGTTGSEATQTTAAKKNGSKSYYQTQYPASRAGFLYTPRTSDLTFAGDFWFEFWHYCLGQGNTTFTGGDNWLIGYGHYASSGLGGILLDDLRLSFAVPNGAYAAVVAAANVVTSNNAWHHYAIGRKNGVLYLFVNGVLAGTANYTGTVGFDDRMGIGGFQDARITNGCYSGMNGYMDRLRIYNRCLTTTNFTPSSDLLT